MADGSIAPPRGQTARVSSRSQNDPRWARLLPWRTGLAGEIGLSDVLASAGLALVWVVGSVVIGVYKVVRRWRGSAGGAAGTSAGATPPAPPS